VELTRPFATKDHGVVSARYEAASARGPEFDPDRFALHLLGHANGYLTLRGAAGSTLAGRPAPSADRFDFTLPVDLIRPLLIALERGAALLSTHQKEVERALALRGDIPPEQRNGWRWF